MKITWLGQAGLLFEKNGVQMMIDPYLSDSVARVNPKNARRVPVEETLFDLSPDIMIFTHDHIDHYDPETAKHFVNEATEITVLSPASVWEKIRGFGGKNNYVRVAPGGLPPAHRRAGLPGQRQGRLGIYV